MPLERYEAMVLLLRGEPLPPVPPLAGCMHECADPEGDALAEAWDSAQARIDTHATLGTEGTHVST